jgi:hypothetical protein
MQCPRQRLYSLPHGDRGRERQPVQPLHEVLRVLTGGIQPNVKVNSRMFFRQLLQDRLELLISRRRFGEVKRLGGRSFLLVQKGDVMTITSRINPDTEWHHSD